MDKGIAAENQKENKMTKQGKNTRHALVWMANTAGKARFYIIVLLVVQAALGINSVLYAMLLRGIVNAAVSGDRSRFFSEILAFAGLLLFHIACGAMYRFFEEFTRSTMENRFKERLFAGLLTKDYAAITRVHSGEWMNRLTSDTVVVADGMTQIIPGVTGMAVKLIGALAAILWMEPGFLYFLIPGGILLVLFTYIFRKVLKRMHKTIQEADGRLRVFFQERLGCLMIVRTFVQERQTADRASLLMGEHKAARMRRNHFSNICNIGFSAAMNGAYALGAAFCGYGILNGTMSYGNFMAVLQLVGQIQNPFANITGYLPKYYAMVASAERLMEVESYEDDCTETVSERDREQFYEEQFCGLGLKNATFTYQAPVLSKEVKQEMPLVLSGVNLEIKKGEHVAFTGPSGCGKSTVLKLLMCLYPLDSGKSYFLTREGERPLTAAWRGLFAYVPQGNQLLTGTIREIVTFGDLKKMQCDEQLWTALEIACAGDFVSKLDQGLDTLLGESGAGLSEGQMQRIAIARAVFSGHPILLLDEATSALDENTAAKLLENLRTMTDKTVILVTHRTSTKLLFEKEVSFSKDGIIVRSAAVRKEKNDL